MRRRADGFLTCRVLISQIALIALAFDWRLPRRSASASASTAATPSITLPRAAHYKAQYTLALLTALSLLATLWRGSWPAVAPVPHREAARIVRAGIWTVHFGIDNEGRDSQRRMRDLIRCVLFVGISRAGQGADAVAWAGIWSSTLWGCWRRICM